MISEYREVSPLLNKDTKNNEKGRTKDESKFVSQHKFEVSQRESRQSTGCLPLPSENAQDVSAKRSFWNHTNCRKKAILGFVALVNLSAYVCITCASPFMARVVEKKGGNTVISSNILLANMITMAVFGIIFGKYQSRIGCKVLLISGQVTFAVCQTAFGTIEYFHSLSLFIGIGIFLRSMQGICQAALSVASLTILCQEFPEFLSFAFGVFEAACGAGYVLGPYVGGVLYDRSGGGTIAPMASTGSFVLLLALTGYYFIKDGEWKGSGTNYFLTKILLNPKAVFIIGSSMSIAGGGSIIEATITIYLKSKGFSVSEVGSLLLLMAIGYCVFAAIAGWAAGVNKITRRLSLIIGSLGAFGLPLLFTSSQTSIWIYIISFAYAVCLAFAFAPGFSELHDVVNTNDEKIAASENLDLDSALSSVWVCANCVFNFSIALVGSAFQKFVPFSLSNVFAVIIGYAFSVLCAICAFCGGLLLRYTSN